MTTVEQRVIENIQRNYFLHPDDIALRESNPDSFEAQRQQLTIDRQERMLEL